MRLQRVELGHEGSDDVSHELGDGRIVRAGSEHPRDELRRPFDPDRCDDAELRQVCESAPNRDPHPKCPQNDEFIGLNSFGVGSPSAPIGTPLDGKFSVSEQRITSDLGGGPGWVLIHSRVPPASLCATDWWRSAVG